jgi:hypothetical protein
MANIRSMDEIAAKYARVTPGRSTDYANGVKSPKKDWKTETINAKDAYAQGVQESIGRGAFEKGVNKAGTAKWQQKAVDLGTTRWGAGVTAAQGDYNTGFAPYQAVIAGLVLPPAGPKGDPRNFDRVVKIGTALHAKKIAG